MGNGVAHGRSRSQGEVNDTERNAEPCGSFVADQLTHTGDFECSFLDNIGDLADVCLGVLAECRAYNTRTGNSDIDLAVVFAHAVECACHEGVILNGIAEYNDLCRAEVAVVLGCLSGVADNLTHHCNCVHVDTCTGGADVYGRTYVACFGKRFRNGLDKFQVAGGESLVDERRVTAEVVYAGAVSRALERLCELHGAALARRGYHCDRCNGDTLVDYRDTVLLFDILAGLYKVLCLAHDLVIDLVARLVDVAVDTVEK